MSDIDASGVGRLPSGLFVITSKSDDGVIDGYLASWVQQVSFKPLMVGFACNPGRPGYENIVNGKSFAINVVDEEKMQFLRYFWKGYSPEENPFKSGDIKLIEGDHGAPIIADSHAYIEGKFHSKAAPGDHEFIMGTVLSSKTLTNGGPKIHLRKSGLDY